MSLALEQRVWDLEGQVTAMAAKILYLEGQIRARLKEEAEAREEAYWEHDTPHTKARLKEEAEARQATVYDEHTGEVV